jgi:hypothetical protein
VSYVVLGYGGALGIGEKRVAVPWESLQFTRDSDKGKMRAILSTTKDRLEQAPRVRPGKDNEDEMRDPAWIGQVYEYYSVQPYWSKDNNGHHHTTPDEYNDRRTDENSQPPKK